MKTTNNPDEPFIKGEDTKRSIIAILLGTESTPKSCVYLAATKTKVEILKLPCEKFMRDFIGLCYGNDYSPKRWAEGMLAVPKVSIAALDHIERILDMGTREKSTTQIITEINELAFDLPADNAVRAALPKTYSDRKVAIAMYTAVRKEVYSRSPTTQKGNDMATKKVKTGDSEDPKAKAAAEAKAKAEADAKAKADGKGGKSGKAAAAKPDVTPNPGASKEDKAKAKAEADAKKKADKEAKAKQTAERKAARKAAVDLTGPFKVGGDALKVKTPEELRLHEGSARYKLMDHVLKAQAKNAKSTFTLEAITKVTGDQTKQALSGMVRYGFLVKA